MAKSVTRREVTPAAQRAVLTKDMFHPCVSFSGQKIVFVVVVRVCFKLKRVIHVSDSTISVEHKVPQPEKNIKKPLPNKKKFKLLLIVDSLMSLHLVVQNASTPNKRTQADSPNVNRCEI